MRDEVRGDGSQSGELTRLAGREDAGAHPGVLGTFIVLEFPDPADQSLVYLESMAGGLFLEDDTEIRRYILMAEHLRAAALRPDQSAALLAAIAQELERGVRDDCS